MGQACHKEIGCCLIGACPLTWCCVQYTMRYRVLNHVYPGSEWNNYLCTQGYCPACCCWNPGNMGEKSCPQLCMCCESICCPGMAISATRFLMMENYRLTPDACDNRLIRFSNCMQCIACICHILACFISQLREAARIMDCIADCVFFSTAGCMVAQVQHEITYRDALGAPHTAGGHSMEPPPHSMAPPPPPPTATMGPA